jgi:hypothetical protein
VEKNPGLFLDLAITFPNKKFAICTGWEELRGTAKDDIERAKRMAAAGKNLSIFTGCTKGRYYAMLSMSKVQFNSGLQDWVSFTLLEALAYGCAPLYPNHRSFPETLLYHEPSLYKPFSVESAAEKFISLVEIGFPDITRNLILDHHSQALTRIADIIAQ